MGGIHIREYECGVLGRGKGGMEFLLSCNRGGCKYTSAFYSTLRMYLSKILDKFCISWLSFMSVILAYS